MLVGAVRALKCSHMRKQWIFVIILFVVITGVVVWFQFASNQKRTSLPVPSPAPTPQSVQPLPDRQAFPAPPPGTTFTYAGPEKPIPESIMTYQIGSTTPDSELNNLATHLSTRLAFSASASAGTIKGNFVFVINEEERSFYLTRNAAGINLSYQLRLATRAQPSSSNPDVIARSFINQLNVFPPIYSVSSLGQLPASGEDILVKDIPPPKIYKYGFGLLINTVPILTSQYSLSWGVIAVDERGVVRLAKAALPFSSLSPENNTKIVSLESALRGLHEGRGALVRISGLNQNYFDVFPAFANGVMSDFTIVYVITGNRLVPAYRFLGSGLTQDGKTQSFEAVVLASSQ